LIWIVTGPPCSGKSTYIKGQAKRDDVIIDMDRIALAISPEDTRPFEYNDKIRAIARSGRAAMVKESIARAQGERYTNVWIIHTDPTPDQRMSYRAANARFIDLDPGKDVCLERLKSRPEQNQAIAKQVIDDFYAKRNK
jgi:tRNA uridine 5-carbamoylmethylation protein Kti12